MPSGLRVMVLRGAIICAALVLVIGTFFLSAGLLAQPSPHTAIAFDETLLTDEPLQIGDIRLSLISALASAQKGNWSVALRLIRDGRNQWEIFVPSMQDTYKAYCWTKGDIGKATQLWEGAIEQTELHNPKHLQQTVDAILGIMDKYRQLRAG